MLGRDSIKIPNNKPSQPKNSRFVSEFIWKRDRLDTPETQGVKESTQVTSRLTNKPGTA